MWVNSYMEDRILRSILQSYRFPSDIFSGSEAQISLLKHGLEKAGRTDTPKTITARANPGRS
jgi:hypothetical protein